MDEKRSHAYAETICGADGCRIHNRYVMVAAGPSEGGIKTGNSSRALLGDSCFGSGRLQSASTRQAQESPKEDSETGQIDPLTLPYVMMSELRFLPDCAGVYFAIEESGEVAYIGQSTNIRQRWRAHHVQDDLCDLTDLQSARRVRVAWLQVEKTKLDLLEADLIRLYKPRLNIRFVPVEKPELKPKRLIEYPIDGSKKMLTIKEAAQLTGASESSIRVWLSDETARKKRFPGARLEQPRAGSAYWLIPESDLTNFELGKPGPKPGAKKGKAK